MARAGEKERALAAARNAPPVPVTRDVVQEITSLYPVDPDPALPLTNHISHIFIFQIAELTTLTLKRMPRLSEPGPLGMRAEHWYDFGSQAGDANLFSLVIAHIATATVLQYLRAGQVTPQAKPTGGHRRTQATPHDVILALTRSKLLPMPKNRGGRAPTRSGVPGRSQQDDEIHTVLCGGGRNSSSGRLA